MDVDSFRAVDLYRDGWISVDKPMKIQAFGRGDSVDQGSDRTHALCENC